MSSKPTITLKWTPPRPLEEVVDDPDAVSSGVYYITRKYGSNVNLYYVGKSAGTGIKGRLKKHMGTTNTQKKGQNMASFAEIKKSMVGDLDLTDVIDDIETVLIYDSQPEYNLQKKNPPIKLKNSFILKNTKSKHSLMSAIIDSDKLRNESVSHPKTPVKMKRGKKDDGYVFSGVDYVFK